MIGMILLPIVERELRMMSRRPVTYYGRMVAAGIVAILGAYLLLVSSFLPIPRSGSMIFGAVTDFLAAMAVLSGWAGADSISREKREGTLGFLFLTDLKGYDIVLGKLVASAVPSLYAALGALPTLAIAMLLGGVTAHQFWEAALAVLNLLFLSHAAAMLGSAMFRHQQNAGGFPGLVLLVYLLVGALSATATAFGWAATSLLLQMFNPVLAVSIALSPSPASALPSYFLSLAATHLTAWLFLALAGAVLPYRWQEKPRNPNRLRVWYEQWRHGSGPARAALRWRLISVNPFFWLVSRRQAGPSAIWIAFGTVTFMFLGLAAFLKRDAGWVDIFPPLLVLAMVSFHLALRIGIVGMVGAGLEAQRRNGGLEVVLSCTPMSVRQILDGQWLALRRWLSRPTLAVVALGVVLAAICILQRDPATYDDLVWFLLTATLMLVPDMIALGWMAMWMAMAERRGRSGSGNAIFCVLVAPWLLIGWLYCMFYCFGLFHRQPPPPWIPWVMIGLTIDIIFCRIARRQLEKNFRRWAVPAYEAPLGIWGRFGRYLGQSARALKSG